jgi:uncharacterized protein (DUF1800 family)
MDRRRLLSAGLARPRTSRPGAREDEPLSPRERAVHLLTRLAFGPRPGDVERVLEQGEEGWLEEQLAVPGDPDLAARLEAWPSLGLTCRELYVRYDDSLGRALSNEERQRVERSRRVPRRELLHATLARMVFARAQLHEVLVDFWRNHFNVSYTKGNPAFLLISDWDRSVLRAHALGRFGDMLVASAHHPAMLHYLDNAASRRPPTHQELAEIERRVRRETGSREAGRVAADLALQRGLNENYARELLELHTLGVDRFYDQDDIVALAEILTGWTWDRGADGSWNYSFRQDMHQAGSKRFLGQRIQGEPEKGKQEGDEVLALLREHKGTSEFIAEKLVRHLVRDVPPPRLVAEVARTFRRSEGDVREMVRTVVASEEFWSRASFRAKFRTPQEFVVAALRASDAQIDAWDALLERLEDMGQPLYHCDDPTGWYDTAEAWLDPGVMAQRWLFARDLVEGRLEGVRLSEQVFADVGSEVPFGAWPDRLTARFVPGGAGNRTWRALAGAIAEDPDALPHPLRLRLLSLLLGSPEFQRQ